MSEVSDLNSIDGTCFFYTSENASNTPDESKARFAGLSVAVSPTWSNQLVMNLGYGVVHVRGRHDGVWEQWRTI